MLFNSLGFALFLPIVFLLYWFIFNRSLKVQNIFLLISSLFFYSCWDWRFVFLLVFSILLDYFSGIKIANAQSGKAKRCWLFISVFINLGVLAVLKYYNFFADSFASFLGLFGLKPGFVTLNVILPVGISFYTFHGLSYVIDIYKERIKPERNHSQFKNSRGKTYFGQFRTTFFEWLRQKVKCLLSQPKSFSAKRIQGNQSRKKWQLRKKQKRRSSNV